MHFPQTVTPKASGLHIGVISSVTVAAFIEVFSIAYWELGQRELHKGDMEEGKRAEKAFI